MKQLDAQTSDHDHPDPEPAKNRTRFQVSTNMLASALVVMIIGLILLYVREFEVFSRTLGVGRLVVGSMIAAILLAAGAIYRWRERLQPWDRHITEVVLVVVFGVLFAPLFGSLLNRSVGHTEQQSFEFISEIPYLSAGYGVLKGEKVRPTGYRLQVREKDQIHHIRYKEQPYYPLTRPGDPVLLPVRVGLFGVRIVDLK